MGKLRVHELAKKLGLENRELIEKLATAGIVVKTHSSSVDEAEATRAVNKDKPAAAPAKTRTRTIVRRRGARSCSGTCLRRGRPRGACRRGSTSSDRRSTSSDRGSARC